MNWLLTLGLDDAVLFRLSQESTHEVGVWPLSAPSDDSPSLEAELVATLSANTKEVDTMLVLVDQPGDILKLTPTSARNRRSTAVLRESIAAQLLEHRRFQAVLREKNQLLNSSTTRRIHHDRYFALEDSKEVHSWIDVLESSCRNAGIDRRPEIIPLVLAVELLLREELLTCTPAIFCHTSSGMVSRHTLYRGGRAWFTRVPLYASSRELENAGPQLAATIEFARSENFLDENEIPHIVVSPDTPPELCTELTSELAETVELSSSWPSLNTALQLQPADSSAPTSAGNLQLYQVGAELLTAANLRWKRHRIDLHGPDDGVSARLTALRLGARMKFFGLTLQRFVLLALLVALVGGTYNASLLIKQRKSNSVLSAQVAQLDHELNQQGYRWDELAPVLEYRQWLHGKPAMLIESLQALGKQLQHSVDVKLTELRWCWGVATEDCLTTPELESAASHRDMTSVDLPTETLQLQITGRLIHTFLSRQNDYERYQELVRTLAGDSQLALLREVQIPHSGLPRGAIDGNETDPSARSFTVLLKDQSRHSVRAVQ